MIDTNRKACYNIEKILKGFSEKIPFYLKTLSLIGREQKQRDYLNVFTASLSSFFTCKIWILKDVFLSQVPKKFRFLSSLKRSSFSH